ncbi:MAG: hypothetical protein JKY18_00120 [Flavobacteriales bacterium]|nr:hypothetical protein [Flavobacteriales bacterium]
MSNTDEKLLALLESKSYNQLSKVERDFVTEHLSAGAYELQREVLFASKELVEEESAFLTPDPRIKSNLSKVMAGRQQGVSVFERIAAYVIRPVPAYQFAIALALLVMLFTWKLNVVPIEGEVVYKEKIVYQELHDTVYVDKPVVEIQTVEKVIRVVEYVEQGERVLKSNPEPYLSEKDRMEEATAKYHAYAFTDQQIQQHQEKSFGNSSVDTRDLARLIGVLD